MLSSVVQELPNPSPDRSRPSFCVAEVSSFLFAWLANSHTRNNRSRTRPHRNPNSNGRPTERGPSSSRKANLPLRSLTLRHRDGRPTPGNPPPKIFCPICPHIIIGTGYAGSSSSTSGGHRDGERRGGGHWG